MALVWKRGTTAVPPRRQTAPLTPLVLSPQVPSFDHQHERIHIYLRNLLGHREASLLWKEAQEIVDITERHLFLVQMLDELEAQSGDTPVNLSNSSIYRFAPVTIKEFIQSPAFLNKPDEVYPEVLRALEEINSGQYVEAVLTGGIGSGKTTAALYSQAYQLYLLSCMRNPHKVYGLDPSSEILLIFQSITKRHAEGVDYRRFRDMVEHSPYFKQHYPFKKGIASKLVFPNRVEVLPVAGNETAAIGQNVMGGIIDELNYMAVVERSKSAADKGTYDQAVTNYNSIARRRKSRFMENGRMPGVLCLVSSKKYPGQFTDQKVEEAKTDPTIYVYDKRTWEIKPDMFGKQGWFEVFVGDLTRKPHIVDPNSEQQLPLKDRPFVISVPNEYRREFDKDIINSLREIAGVSTLARHPFLMEVPKVNFAFKREQDTVFSQSPVDFVETRLTLLKDAIVQPSLPRWVHIDLSVSQDHAGMAIGCCPGFKEVTTDPKTPAFMPRIRIDGILEVRPPRGSEIMFSKLRDVLMALRTMGMDVRWVSFDQFQSVDSQQILRQLGFSTGVQSMDELPCKPYDFLKGALYDGRVEMPYQERLLQELLRLEKDPKTGRVDHPPGGSKDCADALSGVVYGLTMRREIWGMYEIPLVMIPEGIVVAQDKSEEKMKTARDGPEYQGMVGSGDGWDGARRKAS